MEPIRRQVETDLISNRGEGGSGGFHFYDYSNTGERKQLLVLNSNGNALLDGKLEAREIKATTTQPLILFLKIRISFPIWKA